MKEEENHPHLFNHFLEIKKKSGSVFYDTHTHPRDVLGVVGKNPSCCEQHSSPSLLERLKYGNFSLAILRQLFFHAPGYIKKEIIKKYKGLTEATFLKKMDEAGIDQSCIVPLYPSSLPNEVFAEFTSKRFLKLGSVNFSLNVTEIKKDLINQITQYSILGIKLHPNIQGFYPNPEENTEEIREKLKLVYDLAKEHGLYLLFHGGGSYIPSEQGFNYKNYADLTNFTKILNELSSSKIFVVIAHLGIYNITNPDLASVSELSRIKNIYFDTAGVSPAHIERFLELSGPEKLIFGSDMPYFNLKYNITLLLQALHHYKKEKFDENVLKVFSKNFEALISRR